MKRAVVFVMMMLVGVGVVSGDEWKREWVGEWVKVMEGVREVAADWISSVVLKEDGSLWGVGRLAKRLMRREGEEELRKWVKIREWGGVEDVAMGGGHILVLKGDGTVWGIGSNTYGQLGLVEEDRWDREKWVRMEWVKVAEGVVKIAACAMHSFVIKEDGSLWVGGWEEDTDFGVEPAMNWKEGMGWKKVMEGVVDVATGESHALALKADGSVWVVGTNFAGQLGVGERRWREEWTKVMEGAKAVGAGKWHSFVIKEDGSLWGAGDNRVGQVGLRVKEKDYVRSEDYVWRWTKVFEGVKEVSSGYAVTLALKEDGSVWVPEETVLGKVGRERDPEYPWVKVMEGVKAVETGELYAFVLKEDGSLWGIGENGYGQLGIEGVEGE
ncbi:RCC1 domain-containing protein [Spirochaeta thermophila]|nr:chromosome condensation regulator RCC1 [Spirochaeta thermophila]